jgi:hypothetical protein
VHKVDLYNIHSNCAMANTGIQLPKLTGEMTYFAQLVDLHVDDSYKASVEEKPFVDF